MPNHINHILSIKGTPELVAAIKLGIKSDKRLIDFERISSIPEELKGTRCPVMIISKDEYDEQERRITDGELTDIEKDYGIARGITKEMQREFLNRFLYDNWYDWLINEWGTKWNAYDSREDMENGNIHFRTPNSTPFNAIKILSVKYPTAEFAIQYADEDFGYNTGEYTLQNGDLLLENIPTGGSEEAFKIAADVFGTFHIIDTLECITVTEEESLKDNEKKFIEIVYSKKLFDYEYPEFVFKLLTDIAIRNEEYEVAEAINNIKIKCVSVS
jgi:hypothetical protein